MEYMQNGMYIGLLQEIRRNFRTRIFTIFNERMPDNYVWAMSLFHLRRRLSQILHERIDAPPEVIVDVDMRREMVRRLQLALNAHLELVQLPANRIIIQSLFDNVIQPLVITIPPAHVFEGICLACFTRDVSFVFQPCGHASMCNNCLPNIRPIVPDDDDPDIWHLTCPSCREPFQSTEQLQPAQLAILRTGGVTHDSHGRRIFMTN